MHGIDHCARLEVIRKIKQQEYWFAYLHAMVDEYLATCEVCTKKQCEERNNDTNRPYIRIRRVVEKLNGTLKAKLNKICESTKLNWIDALSLALMSYRMQTNRNTHLTPHEMLMSRPMPVPYCRGHYKGPPLEQLQMKLRSYMRKLTAIHTC